MGISTPKILLIPPCAANINLFKERSIYNMAKKNQLTVIFDFNSLPFPSQSQPAPKGNNRKTIAITAKLFGFKIILWRFYQYTFATKSDSYMHISISLLSITKANNLVVSLENNFKISRS